MTVDDLVDNLKRAKKAGVPGKAQVVILFDDEDPQEHPPYRLELGEMKFDILSDCRELEIIARE